MLHSKNGIGGGELGLGILDEASIFMELEIERAVITTGKDEYAKCVLKQAGVYQLIFQPPKIGRLLFLSE